MEEGHSRVKLINPKSMNHHYDVINLHFYGAGQKIFARSYDGLCQENLILTKYSVYYDQVP